MSKNSKKKKIAPSIISTLAPPASLRGKIIIPSIAFINQNKNKKFVKIVAIFLFLAILSFGFYEFKTILSGYLEWKYSKTVYQKALAEMPVDYSFLRPFRNWNVKPLELNAKAAISYLHTNQGSKIIFAKNIEKPLPIASLSKLFTAYVALKSYDLDKEVELTKEIIETEEEIGQFWIGEKFTVKDLLHSALIESSNDAAMALASGMGKEKFVKLLNSEVKSLGLKHTFFADPVGVDPDYPGEPYNFSTAYDLAKFTSSLVLKSKTDPRIDLMWEITKIPEYYLYRPDGSFHHKMINTNKLLEEFKDEIIGGKTGYTPMAKECFILVIKSPRNEDGFIVNVILGSDNRFKDMKQLINWTKQAYIW